jgi:hypothetical protein
VSTATDVAATSATADPETERLLLGAMIVASVVPSCRLAASDFTDIRHRRVYAALLRLHERGDPIDHVTVQADLARKGDLLGAGGPLYLDSLTDGVPRFSSVDAYAEIVADRAQRRQLVAVAERVAALARSEDRAVDAAEKAISLLRGVGAEPECSRCGRDACAGDCAPPVPPLVAVSAGAVTNAAPPRWVVEGFVVENGVHLLVSESGTGKTFVLLSLAAHLATGADWFGLATSAGSVVYVGFEADALGLRLQALEGAGCDLANVYVIRASDPISPSIGRDGREAPSVGEAALTSALIELVERLAREGKPPIVAVMIDTVRASMSGSEDRSEDASAYLRAVRRILRAVAGAAAILAHHSGWQDGEVRRKRERGSSAFRGNVDGVAYLEADEDAGAADPSHVPLVLRVLKARDAQRPEVIRLVRQRVEVPGVDRRGDPLSSCLIVSDARTRADRESETRAVEAAQDRQLELRVLQAVREFPNLTNRERIRQVVKAGKPAVNAAVARLVLRELLVEGLRGAPFTLTPEGIRAADGGLEW